MAIFTWLILIVALVHLVPIAWRLVKAGLSANQKEIDNLVDDALFQRYQWTSADSKLGVDSAMASS